MRISGSILGLAAGWFIGWGIGNATVGTGEVVHPLGAGILLAAVALSMFLSERR
jgi:hypothetical protein